MSVSIPRLLTFKETSASKGFKLIFDMLSPRNPKVAALRTEDVFDGSYVKELIDKGLFQ